MRINNYNLNERMKHAYLVMCHNQFDLLKKQLMLLDDERNDIYIHIDKKVKNFPEKELKEVLKKSNMYLVERVKVNWGGYSQIQAEIHLLEAAVKGCYGYYHLLSGVDLPIKSQDYIHDFFRRNYGKEFIRFDPNQTRVSEFRNRINYYYVFQNYIGRNKGWKYGVLEKLQNVSLFLQQACRINRLKEDYVIKKGTNWFSITHDLAEHLVQEKTFIKKQFKYGKCADELFLQTIVYHSTFMPNVIDNSLRLIDWKRGNPYTFLITDYEELALSDRLFARKFDPDCDYEIINKICNQLKRNNKL